MTKNTRKILIISIVIVIFAIFFGYSKFTSKNKIVLDEHSELLSIWVEDSSGNYQAANSFPGAGYILDKTRSKCENGGVLSGDGTGVTLEAEKTDKCYLYFMQPWINTNTTRTLTCNSSAKTFDYRINGASFAVSTDADLTCTTTKTANSTSQTFAAYLISLSGTTQGTGQMVNENGYRYEGKDPNNYIWFNNEMWRIIGVFGSNRHGVANTNLVKIIREESIGGYAWNGVNSANNNWATSTLYRMLNGCYYNALTENDTTNISGSNVACSNYCISYYYGTTAYSIANCDFSYIGIQDDKTYSYRDMVQNVTWYLGGPGNSSYNTYYPANIYGYETNSSAVYSGNPASVTGYIGLMYLSDYGYSVLSSNCARGSYSLYTGDPKYNNISCASNSWMYGKSQELTIDHVSDMGSYVWTLYFGGSSGINDHIFSYSGVRPVLYLKANTYKVAGIGTRTDPYVVGIP